MKKIVCFYLLPMLVLLTTACSTKTSKDHDSQVLRMDSVDAHGIQRMQLSRDERAITVNGKEFQYSLQRTPCDSLPRVTAPSGDVFVDNEISLRITREGRSQVFSKTFTKQSFSSLIDARFLSESVLEGMVLDKVTPQGMVYAVSICYPQTDLCYFISMTIAPNGEMSMVKEELMDDVYAGDEYQE